jgi:methionyl-tRNA synthetase
MNGGKRKILVTSALPYANGSIHIGHLVEYIQTDIWVRFQKLCGNECRYMCADDTHGTPIMISANKQGITPEELVGRMHREHSRDFADFQVEFDNYYTTNSVENRHFAELIYTRLKDKGHIDVREIEQAWCPHDKMFLPDRMIRGTCPRCQAADQYGDSCEVCSATYNPTDLKDARCSICGTAPVTRTSSHYFFKLGDFADRLKEWLAAGPVQEEMRNKLGEWFAEGLKDWDISRDAPYFGFRIPGTEDKYFYVWLDAPIGYMASTRNWCEKNGRSFEEFWLSPDSEIVHFIGKDIVYFHTLFWPAMLMGADFRAPNKVYVHGFLTVNGQKMSKSRGTFLSARQYLSHLDPEYLRYYYACKLTARVEDIDLNLSDFVARVNADLGNQFANLGSRVISFLHKRLDGKLGKLTGEGLALVESLEKAADEIAELYECREYSRAMKRIAALAHDANQYVANAAPWSAVKDNPEKARSILTAAVNAFAILNLYLTPVMPAMSRRVEKILGRGNLTWNSAFERLEERAINPFESVFTKATDEAVEALLQSGMQPAAGTAPATPGTAATDAAAAQPAEGTVAAQPPAPVVEEPPVVVPPQAAEIPFDDFAKVDLRVAKIVEAKGVDGADKLVELLIDLGQLGRRTIFAGIKKTHKPEELVGRQIIVVANLAPRKMKFGTSHGMLLAASSEGTGVYLAGLETGAKPGQRIS